MKRITFANGRRICALGLGTWNMGLDPFKKESEKAALLTGIDLGMTMIDTAEMYKNESFIGETIRGIRDKVFLVSKVLPEHADYEGTIKACENSLKKLNTDHLDMYLLHWKGSVPFEETVEAMETLQKSGKIGLWGVSNIDIADLKIICSLPFGNTCATNQVLYNLQNRGIEYDLLPWSRRNLIPITAYTPAGDGTLVNHPALKHIAEKHESSTIQIALSWILRQNGVMAIPKASSARHVEENFKSLELQLDEDDLKDLDTIFPPPKNKMKLAWR